MSNKILKNPYDLANTSLTYSDQKLFDLKN